jgi:hypothetical protein
MAVKTNKKDAKLNSKSYISKDFNSLRRDLVNYARNYFPDKIQDFSEAGLGGMLVELAAYVGDTMTYYLDYQFNELNPETAIEVSNIQNHARNAGLKFQGAAPSVAEVTFYIEAPAKLENSEYVPDISSLPSIKSETTLLANNGVTFILTEDLNFFEKDPNGNLNCDYKVSRVNATTQVPTFFVLTKKATCLSGELITETFKVGSSVPFRKISLSKIDVSEILQVKDSERNEYYQVESLTDDSVFKSVKNLSNDFGLVHSNLEVIPAPYRYIYSNDFITRLTTIQFGSGDADSTDDDIFPDPSDLAIPLYGKKKFSKFSLNPNKLLKTRTLGITPVNTTISVTYRHGGGLNHNVNAETIQNISALSISFPQNPGDQVQNFVINSLQVINENPASGGSNPLTLEEFRSLINLARNQQSRIVTQQDLLARLYTLPSEFGRVYRAGIRKNEEDPLSSELYIASLNNQGNLSISPDSLKKNISNYINEYRLISDSVKVLDITVINYSINFSIVCTPNSNKSSVLANAIDSILRVSQLKYFQVDQPIVRSDVVNAIINTEGVLSLVALEFNNKRGSINGLNYSDYQFDLNANSYKGLIVGPPGSIFELRYPQNNIVGSAE